MEMERSSRIFIAGHKGMVGSAIAGALRAAGYENILEIDHDHLDLCQQQHVKELLLAEPIDMVIIAAAKVGGIFANQKFPADFIYENLAIQSNLIHGAHEAKIDKLLFIGSSCIYPKICHQPIKETALLTGPLEPTSEPFAIAKIAGIKMCQAYNKQYGTDFRCVMPCSLYGPNDHFHPEYCHVIPALLNRFHFARNNGDKTVQIWGSGKARREYLHVDDAASACVQILSTPKKVFDEITADSKQIINIGSGQDIPIAKLASLIAKIVGFTGDILFDQDKPDGTLQKLSDTTGLKSLGWQSTIELRQGLADTYAWYKKNLAQLRQ